MVVDGDMPAKMVLVSAIVEIKTNFQKINSVSYKGLILGFSNQARVGGLVYRACRGELVVSLWKIWQKQK